MAKVDQLAAQEIFQPSGRGYDNGCAFAQLVDLALLGHSADDERGRNRLALT